MSNMNWKYIGFFIVMLACQAWTIHSQCQQVNATNSTISDSHRVSFTEIIERCWKIAVAGHHFIYSTIELPVFGKKKRRNCDNAYVEIKMDNFSSKKFCGFDNIGYGQSFSSANDSYFELVFYVNSAELGHGDKYEFLLTYFILPEINGINEAREVAINWMKKRHNPFWGWKEDTPRAVTALYLSGAAQFNGTLNEEIMAKQAELRTALALTWDSVSTERLSTFINALLATCLKPRNFYGHDLVARLKNQVESSDNFTHPAAYLALCNANESWPNRSTADLSYVLTYKLDFPFVRVLQAFAIMALSCDYNHRNTSFITEDSNLRSIFFESIKRMKEYQQPDGSFGSPHTTALIIQALMASNQTFINDWNVNDGIQYLMKELNTSDINFLSVYATLPLLNGKTLTDIALENCTENPRFEGEDPTFELKDNNGPKILIQYSLYIGNQKNVIDTSFLQVPKNSSADKVMEIAAMQNKKYKFKVETTNNVKYICEIADIANDPEVGMSWLLYVNHRNSSGWFLYTSNPENLILEDRDHLIMWYERQKI